MAFNLETQRSNGGVKNDITIVYLSSRRKSCVVEKWISKNLSQNCLEMFHCEIDTKNDYCVFKWRFVWRNIYVSIIKFCCEKKRKKLKKTFYDLKQENQTWCWKTNTFLQEYGMLGTIPTMTSTY